MKLVFLSVLVLLAACSPQVPAEPAGIPVGNDSPLVPPVETNYSLNLSDEFLENLLVDWTGDKQVIPSGEVPEDYSGGGVEFYLATGGAMVRDRLGDGETRKYGEGNHSYTVEVSFIGESSRGGIALFRVNNRTLKTLREKESDSFAPGKFIYVMEINYR